MKENGQPLKTNSLINIHNLEFYLQKLKWQLSFQFVNELILQI